MGRGVRHQRERGAVPLYLPLLAPAQPPRRVSYPATLVTTADHDDRVVPAHSFKFAAELQHCQAGKAPVLIRIDKNAGHGAGKPTSKRIDEATDVYSFLFQNTNTPTGRSEPKNSTGKKTI